MNWQVTAALGILLGLTAWMLKGAIEDRVKFQIASQTAEIALESQKETGRLNQKITDLTAKSLLDINTLKVSQEKDLRELRNKLEKEYAQDPFGAAADSERRLALSLCLYENGNNREGRSSCHDRVAKGYTPRFASIIAATPETIEGWRILCEDGKQDFCDYTLIAFTKEGWLSHLDWHNAADRDQLALRDRLDAEKEFRKLNNKR